MPSKTSNPKPADSQLAFEAIGTQWLISTGSKLDAATALAIKRRIAEFDSDYSRFKADSWLRQVGSRPGTYDMPADAEQLFDLYQQLYDATSGATTPLIGQTLSQAGYDENYSLQAGELTRPASWHQALDYRFPSLTVKKPVLLDVGAAGKGYLVDIVADLLRAADHNEFVVNAGGDIKQYSRTERQEIIGLEHPGRTDEVIGLATIANRSLCGSAGNRRRWAGYDHIIDPRTLQSPTKILAVWTVASSALLADGLSTALYFAEPNTLLQSFSFEYAIMYSDGSLRHSELFPAEFFTR